MVLGLLVAFAIVLFAVARTMGADSQGAQVLVEPLHLAEVQKNIAPFAQEAIAGKDNSALAALSAPAGAAPAASVPTTGEQAFKEVCSACHETGVNGAPKIGDHAAWGPRIAQGKDVLYKAAHLGQGQYAAQRRHELAGCDNPHDRRLHGVAQQIGRSSARSFTASATSTIRISGADRPGRRRCAQL